MSNHGGPPNDATAARVQAATEGQTAPRAQTGPLSIGSETRAKLSEWFGGARLSNEDIRAMTGAGPGASVSAMLDHEGRVEFQVRGPLMEGVRSTDMERLGTSEYVMHRILGHGLDYTRPDALVMLNERFMMREEVKGQGLGSALFARQVATLTRLGHVAEIGTEASRSGNAVRGYAHNGFYTWALLGYDKPMDLRYDMARVRRTPTTLAPIARRIARDPQARAAAEQAYDSYGQQHSRQALALTPLKPATKARWLTLAARGKLRLSDMLATPDGQAWWKYHGERHSLTFDLAPDSRSQRQLARYLAERARQGRPVPPL